SVSDNGVGLSEDEKRHGVGSSLFEAFAIQLEGEFEVTGESGKGVQVSVRFPLEHPDLDLENFPVE
ncbi:MAG TPA: hypothetical protein DCQ53_14465, partial [Alphaproteobacteria bacterium]|nr:hypothetical protein [Alphaproteobacteria bacterium]